MPWKLLQSYRVSTQKQRTENKNMVGCELCICEFSCFNELYINHLYIIDLVSKLVYETKINLYIWSVILLFIEKRNKLTQIVVYVHQKIVFIVNSNIIFQKLFKVVYYLLLIYLCDIYLIKVLFVKFILYLFL